jgi:hypothetical protein
VAIVVDSFTRQSRHKQEFATDILGKIKRIMVKRYVPAYAVAICYVGLGKQHDALAWLTKACEERSAESPLVNVDPRLSALHVEPGFRQLLSKLGFNR